MATVEEFLTPYSLTIRDLALRTRELVLNAMPEAVEQVNPGYKNITYAPGSRMADAILYISPHTSHVNLGFMQGTQLPDSESLLEGTGKLLRHVKIRKVEDVERPALRALLEAALEPAT